MDCGDFVCAVAGDVPGVAGFVDLLLVDGESGIMLAEDLVERELTFLQVFEGKPVFFGWPSFCFGAVAGVALVRFRGENCRGTGSG